MVITENVLSAEEHLQFRVLKPVAQFAQSFPRIFLQEAQGRVKCCTTPAFHRIVAHFVHLVYYWQHLFGGHSCCNQGLMGITQNSLRNF